MLKEYFELVRKHREASGPNTAVLMQCGKFYEVYGYADDEEGVHSPMYEVANICDLKVARRGAGGVSAGGGGGNSGANGSGENNSRMTGVPVSTMDKYVEILLDAGWTVAVYAQSSIPGRNDRSLTHIFTPGTFFSEHTGVSNNFVVLWTEYRPMSVARPNDTLFFGLACLDNMAGTVTLDEHTRSPLMHDSSDLDWVQEQAIAYNPREIRVVAGNERSTEYAHHIAKAMGQLCPQACTRVHLHTEPHTINAQKQAYQDEVVRICYGDSKRPESLTLMTHPHASSALTLLLAEAKAADPSLVQRLDRPLLSTAVPHLTMANHSLRQLNIVHTPNGANSRYSSVVHAITGGCMSKMGRREAVRRIRAPLVDSHAINSRLAQVAVLVNTPELLSEIRARGSHIPDGEHLFREIVHKTATPQTIGSRLRQYIAQVIACISPMYVGPHSEEAKAAYGEQLGKVMDCAVRLSDYVRVVFREEQADVALLPENHAARWLAPVLIQDAPVNSTFREAWEEFVGVLQEVEQARGMLANLVKLSGGANSVRVRKDGGMPQLVELTWSDDGGAMLIATERRTKMVQDWIHRKTHAAERAGVLQEGVKAVSGASKKYRFENDAIRELLGRLGSAKQRVETMGQERFEKALEELAGMEEQIRLVNSFVAGLDVASTAAKMAVENRCCRPQVAHSGNRSWFEAVGLRHMLAERIDNEELFVPNDMAFGSQNHPDGLLLFGTNASGKSTLIKSVGIAVVLAQSGFYVPAERFAIRPYAAVYTRILGNDDLFRGLSTFAVEMTEFNAILRNANPRTLVLGDEVCSGTETVSAIAIFASGLVSLASSSCTHMFATHFHEVTRLPCVKALPGLVSKHLQVRYDAEADTLVYNRKLEDGPGDSIYGLEVCKSLRMPQDFLDRAYEVRAELLPEGGSVLGSNTSRYSSKKVRGVCELCGAAGEHVHHLQHQADADGMRLLGKGAARVDAAANLVNVCRECHDKFHADGDEAARHRKVKTIDGRTVIVQEE